MTTTPSNLTLRVIRDYAEKVGEHYSIYDEVGCADIDGLVAQLGGRVHVQDGPESLKVLEEDDFVINVPSSTSARRDRFTIAHELGHYFLHYIYPELSGPKSFDRGASNRAETEANTFASSLLMPAGAFRRAHEATGGNARRLAAMFDVSPRAAEVRCSVLGLSVE